MPPPDLVTGPAEAAVEPSVLLGRWQLTRRIRDDRAGLVGAVDGQLTLRAEGELIAWVEQGTLRWNGSCLPVSRVYRLQPTETGWWLYFPDGRAFHPWSPGDWVRHPCRADVYHGLIKIDGPDAWRTLWDVRGPSKSQRILTRMSRPATLPSGSSRGDDHRVERSSR